MKNNWGKCIIAHSCQKVGLQLIYYTVMSDITLVPYKTSVKEIVFV